jgi:hypothetical protein
MSATIFSLKLREQVQKTNLLLDDLHDQLVEASKRVGTINGLILIPRAERKQLVEEWRRLALAYAHADETRARLWVEINAEERTEEEYALLMEFARTYGKVQ